MKKRATQSSVIVSIVLLSLLPGLNMLSAQSNTGFESGTFAGWTGTFSAHQCSGTYLLGQCAGCGDTNPLDSVGFNQGPNNDPASDPTNEYSHIITTTAGGNDPNLTSLGATLPMVWPGGGNYSSRMGNMWQTVGSDATGDGETTSYSFLVTTGNSNFIYHYAVVLNDGGHAAGQQPYFNIGMKDSSGNAIPVADYQVDATTAATIGGFNNILASNVFWKPWTSVLVPLSAYIGQRVTITFTTRGCLPSGCAGSHYAYAYIDAETSPQGISVSATGGCAALGAMLTAAPGGATYSWAGPGIVGRSDTNSISINQPGDYSVTITTLGNQPDTFVLDTLIPANFNSLHASFSITGGCAGGATQFNDLSTPSGTITSWAWDFNNDGTTDSTSQNPTYVFASTGTYPVKLTITSVACSADTTINITIANGPAPTATFTAMSPVCEGQNSTITYTGTGNANETYTWNFGGGNVFSGSGTGPFQVNWISSGTKNITLTVANGGCTSALVTVPVTVNAIPVSDAGTNVTICGDSSAVIGIAATSGYAYSWSPSVGLNSTTASSPTVSLSATGSNIVTQTYTVITSSDGCQSNASVTVTVNPVANVSFSLTGPLCNGGIDTIHFTGNASVGATFSWNLDGANIINTSQGGFTVNWTGPQDTAFVALTISQFGCVSSFADTFALPICTGVEQLQTGGISIYPNPAKDDFTIEVNQGIQNGQLEIYNVLGQRVYLGEIKDKPSGFSQQIHLAAATGVYVVKLSNGERVYTGKMVME